MKHNSNSTNIILTYVYACLVSILIFQLVESIILLPEMSTINEMLLVTDVDPDKVTDKYYTISGSLTQTI